VAPKKNGDKLVELTTHIKDINVGDILNRGDIEKELKVNPTGATNEKRSAMLGPWMKAVPFATRRNVFMVNGNRQSWHYGWVASPFIPSEMKHRLAIYFFKQSKSTPGSPAATLECVDHIYSPTFKVMSSRRKYPKGGKAKASKKVAKKVIKSESSRSSVAPIVDPSTLNGGLNRKMSLKDVLNTAYGSVPHSPKTSVVRTPTSATTLTSNRKRSLESLETAPCDKKLRRNSINKQPSFANLYGDNSPFYRNIIQDQASMRETDVSKSKRKDSDEGSLMKMPSFAEIGALTSNGSFQLSSNGSFALTSNGSFKDGFDISAYKDYDVFANDEALPGIDWKLLESNGSFVIRPVQNSSNV
jgi:hypothetical protein